MTRSGTRKRVDAPATPSRRSSKRIQGRKPGQVLSSSLLRRICRMPPEGKRAYTKAKVWYLNPQFRKDHEAGSRSVCNVCREVHPPRGSDEQAPVKVQQEVQTEKVCSCSSSSGSSGDQTSKD
ncbi:uncharacterized protein LOC6592920 isoform X1 [Drosophila persimilis]|uniref:uncharacterized protein LOC6592920 isoform X1 n=2 Tax=Drosophila persimilis TaxID=7234 RepID=UPI000F097FBE|nr:uncharacterized protein LOC6592920 isoform X1 [Drosophila persimilis]